MRDVLQDAFLAWVQGAEETRGFPDFASWCVHRLAEFDLRVVSA
jgi:hypothetical protein